jgi:hypothetical protein
MRLSLASGKHYSLICFVFLRLLTRISYMNWTDGGLCVAAHFSDLTGATSFRLVPTFGRDTIRRFSRNTSELKRMAAWNYEDILQVGTS